MHSSEILADDPQSKQLSAGENGNDRSQERKSRYGPALDEIPADHIAKYSQSNECEEKADDAGDLQRQCAEAGHHVHGMSDQFAQGVIGDTDGARIISNLYGRKASGSPRQ